MKLEFQSIVPSAERFLTMTYHGPANPCDAFWHYHPEWELIYVPHGNGRRHIGGHISDFTQGDLALISANTPHLNFGFQAQRDHEEIVIQFSKETLMQSLLNLPEFRSVAGWLNSIQTGIVMPEAAKSEIGSIMVNMLTAGPVDRLLTFLNVLATLSTVSDLIYLDPLSGLTYPPRDQHRVNAVYQYVQCHYQSVIKLGDVADVVGLSPAAFCRFFKKMTKLNFTEFLTEYRIRKVGQRLLDGEAITTAAFESGFANISHFNVSFRKIMGMSPTQYRQKWAV